MNTTRNSLRLGLAASLLIAGAAQADPVSDFYRGKTVELIVGSGAGGGYDANARLVARYLGQYIPGKPTVIVTNHAGAGGITAGNLVANVSPRDGSVIATFSNAMITEPLLGNGSAKFDPTKLTWIGSVTSEDGICVSWHDAGVSGWADLTKTKQIVGTAAPGTTTYTYPALLKNMFGAKFELISGYPDGAQSTLAMERGEVQSVCQTLSTLQSLHPAWIRDRQVVPLILMGLERNPDLPDLPAVSEMATDATQTQMLKLFLAPTFAGRPLFAPPGIPADRAAALRTAFDTVMKDASLLSDARTQNLEVKPATGAEISTLVDEIYRTPPELIAKVRAVSLPK